MLSADISGFTAMSERHSAQGRAGSEKLLTIMSSCFTGLIDAATAQGGDVLKFGGDALLILFTGGDHRRRCAAAGVAMQRALRESPVARRARLTMTVGATTGSFDVVLAGSERRELLVVGRCADRVIRLESAAATGETLVDSAIAEQFPPAAVVGAHHGGFVIDPELTLPETATARPSSVGFPLEPFVPGPVVEQLDAFADLGGEHRFATVGFLEVSGVNEALDRDPAVAARRIGDVIDAVAEICDGLGVAPLETDISTDGFKFVLSAGAPLTRGNTNDALLRSALRIVEFATSLRLRIGVQTGRVFAGFIGHPQRRTYSMIGDCMSTAARMLTVAEDRDVVAVDDVVSGTRVPFVTDAIEPFVVKGKNTPITAHRIRAVSSAPADIAAVATPRPDQTSGLIGRDDEVDAAVSELELAGACVEFVGEAGLGKTALVDAVLGALAGHASRSRDRASVGHRTARITAHDNGAAPYADLAPAVRHLVGLDSSTDLESDLQTVVATHAPELVGVLPLIAQALGLEVSDTATTTAIEPRFRRDATVAAVVAVLGAIDPTSTSLLVVDDAHWLDESSAALLAGVAANTTGAGPRVLMTTRIAPSAEHRVRRIDLAPLDDASIKQLATSMDGRALSDEELDLIADRAAGNPLLATELVRAMATADLGALPDSIERLVAVRIDALAPAARRLLRIAAVIGSEFDIDTLDAVLAIDGATIAATLRDDLGDLVRSIDGERWVFERSVHRDVAYGGLPFRERRRLHALVGEHLEAAAADHDDLDALAATLSVHWANAGRHDAAWTCSVVAGNRAVRASSPHDAIGAYSRALESARHARSVTARQRADVAIRLGDVAETAGRYDVAAAAYERARRALPADDPGRLGLFRRRGILHEREGRYAQALRWYVRGQSVADERGDRTESVELDVAIAGIRFRQARYEESVAAATAAADDGDAPPKIRLRACYIVQLAAQYLGDRSRRDRYGALGSELATAADDPVLEANLYNNLGISAYYEDDLDHAAELYERAAALRTASGDLIGAVTSVNNLGELRSDQGLLDEAEALFDEALRRAAAAGYEMAVHVAESNLGRLATRRGDHDSARRLLTAALAGFERIGSVGFALETRLRLLQNEPPERLSERSVLDLLRDGERLGGGAIIEAPTRRLLARLRRGAGDVDGARHALERALASARREHLNGEVRTCTDELEAIGTFG